MWITLILKKESLSTSLQKVNTCGEF